MQNERRRFFRIDDNLSVAYEELTDTQVAHEKEKILGGDNGLDLVANFDNRIHTLLGACKVQTPELAEVIDLLNKKLNFAISQMGIDADLMQQMAYSMRKVNLSACGVAFGCEQQFKEGSSVKLYIALGATHIALIAKVIKCERDVEEYFVRFDFEAINTTDQELLIQHVVKRQSSILKRAREEESSRD